MNNAPTELATELPELAKAPAGEAVPVSMPTTVGRRFLAHWPMPAAARSIEAHRHIVLRSGGDKESACIKVASTPGQGACFRITLPIDQPPEAEYSVESNS